MYLSGHSPKLRKESGVKSKHQMLRTAIFSKSVLHAVQKLISTPPMQCLPLVGSVLACFLQPFGPLAAQRRSVGPLNEQSHMCGSEHMLVILLASLLKVPYRSTPSQSKTRKPTISRVSLQVSFGIGFGIALETTLSLGDDTFLEQVSLFRVPYHYTH